MADLADLIERLNTGCVCIGSDDDNPDIELFDVEGASDTMAEAAEALTAALSGQTAVPVADEAKHDLVNVLKSVLYHFGPEGAQKVTSDALRLRRSSDSPLKQALIDGALATPVSPAPDAEMLSPANTKALLDAIENPPQPAEKLKDLFRPDVGWREVIDEMMAALAAAKITIDGRCLNQDQLDACQATLDQIDAAISKALAAGGAS